MNKLVKLCKKFKIRLTVKKNGKRVYKSKSVLMKQLKRKMRKSKFGCWDKKTSFGIKAHFKKNWKKYGLALVGLGALGAAGVAARKTKRGKKTFVKYNKYLDDRQEAIDKTKAKRKLEQFKLMNKVAEEEAEKEKAKEKMDFGRKVRKNTKSKKLNKLKKLCKRYNIKIGKKSFSKLRTDCMKKIKMLLKRV